MFQLFSTQLWHTTTFWPIKCKWKHGISERHCKGRGLHLLLLPLSCFLECWCDYGRPAAMLGHEDEGHTVGTIVQKVKRLQGSLVGSHTINKLPAHGLPFSWKMKTSLGSSVILSQMQFWLTGRDWKESWQLTLILRERMDKDGESISGYIIPSSGVHMSCYKRYGDFYPPGTSESFLSFSLPF